MHSSYGRTTKQMQFLVLLILLVNQTVFSLEMTVRLPAIRPAADAHVCTWLRMPSNESLHLTQFSPLVDERRRVTHHMMLFGCSKPASVAPVYLCKSFTTPIKGILRNTMSPCSSNSRVLFVWTRGTEELKLPSDVAFEVGGTQHGDNIHYLVLQVHYTDTSALEEDYRDTSGLQITYTKEKPAFKAGIISAITLGRIAPKGITRMEQSCSIVQDFEHYPIAFRTHTHGMGRVVSGYRVRNKKDWLLLGKNNPQMPQSFLPVANKHAVLRKNDVLATRCTMVNNNSWAQYTGGSKTSEMCIYYLLFYTHGTNEMKKDNVCAALGPPLVDWTGSIISGGLSNVPDEDASSLDVVNMK